MQSPAIPQLRGLSAGNRGASGPTLPGPPWFHKHFLSAAHDVPTHFPSISQFSRGIAVATTLAIAKRRDARQRCRGLVRLSQDQSEQRMALGRPQIYVLGSALLAALMSLEAGMLSGEGVPLSTIAGACGLVSAVLVARGTSCIPWKARGPVVGAWILQSILGGLLPHLAFYSIPRCGLAVSNCLMFTMPLWTAIFAAIFLNAPWGPKDMLLASISLAGVVLVTQPPPFFAAFQGSFHVLGVLAGIGFGVCGGALNLLIGGLKGMGALKGMSARSLSVAQMAATFLISLPSLVLLLIKHHSLIKPASSSLVLWVQLVIIGVLMASQLTLRTEGLQIAKNSTVAVLLYTEILWCFIFEIFVLSKRCMPFQIVGASLIFGSAIVSAFSTRSADDA